MLRNSCIILTKISIKDSPGRCYPRRNYRRQLEREYGSLMWDADTHNKATIGDLFAFVSRNIII